MRVGVDETGRQHQAGEVDVLVGGALRDVSDRGDDAVGDEHVVRRPRAAGAVDDDRVAQRKFHAGLPVVCGVASSVMWD